MPLSLRRWSTAAALAVSLAAVIALVPITQARAATAQISIFQDDPRLDKDPATTLGRMRLLGAQVVRVSVPWYYIAPDINSKQPPVGFNPTDPADYPAVKWGLWDEIVTEAHAEGMTVDFDLMGGPPRWALGPGRPAGNTNPNWEPNAADFGGVVRAVGTRYSGDYDPSTGTIAPGDPNDLPRVNFWPVWTERDYGRSLAPQGVPGHLRIENSPRMYRNLLDAAWSSLVATGHGPSTDTILFG